MIIKRTAYNLIVNLPERAAFDSGMVVWEEADRILKLANLDKKVVCENPDFMSIAGRSMLKWSQNGSPQHIQELVDLIRLWKHDFMICTSGHDGGDEGPIMNFILANPEAAKYVFMPEYDPAAYEIHMNNIRYLMNPNKMNADGTPRKSDDIQKEVLTYEFKYNSNNELGEEVIKIHYLEEDQGDLQAVGQALKLHLDNTVHPSMLTDVFIVPASDARNLLGDSNGYANFNSPTMIFLKAGNPPDRLKDIALNVLGRQERLVNKIHKLVTEYDSKKATVPLGVQISGLGYFTTVGVRSAFDANRDMIINFIGDNAGMSPTGFYAAVRTKILSGEIQEVRVGGETVWSSQIVGKDGKKITAEKLQTLITIYYAMQIADGKIKVNVLPPPPVGVGVPRNVDASLNVHVKLSDIVNSQLFQGLMRDNWIDYQREEKILEQEMERRGYSRRN